MKIGETSMLKITLNDSDKSAIDRLLDEVLSQFSNAEDEQFLLTVGTIAHELPRRLRTFIYEFKLHEPDAGICLISGYDVDQVRIGATPVHWRDRGVSEARESIYFSLLGSLLGELIGWSGQQDGNIIHDVLPIEADKDEQISSGSNQVITWHTEDAFHPFRGDYVGLMCLRNPDETPTTIASIGSLELDDLDREILFQERFTIRPDNSHEHLGENGAANKTISLLFGHPDSPYVRADPYFMDNDADDSQAKHAFEAFCRQIDSAIKEIVLQPGDCVFVDNYKAVHGRGSFTARFDGTDRWLKRVNIVRDLRKSRSAREVASARVIQS